MRPSSQSPEHTVKQSNKPVVAMIADYPLDPEAIDGGLQAVTVYLVRELLNLNEVDLRLVSFYPGIRASTRVHPNGLQQYLLPRQRLGAPTLWRYDFLNLNRCLNRIGPTVVHAQGAGLDGYLAVKSGYPSVVTFHGIIREDAKYKSRLRERLRLRMQSWLTEEYCARYAQRTILISEYVNDYYGDALESPTHFIPNPVDKKFFEVKRQEECGRILFAGRVIPRKGVGDLIEAFAMTRQQADVRLILAGSLSDKAYVERLKGRVIDLGISPYVEFLGLLKEAELLDQFARATMLVLPSYQETAPMVIQQAMAAALPVVASRICGIPGQLDQGTTGCLFEPGDVRSLASHMMRLVQDQGYRVQMANGARVKAQAEYRAEHVAEKTMSVYRELGGWN
jgi:glycosyltransferase involved in cell wall biosynthesis